MEENLQSSAGRGGSGWESNSLRASVCSLVNHSGAAVQSRGGDTIVETAAEVPSIRCSLSRPAVLPNRTFHLEIDQTLQFDAVFHWKLAYEIVDKSIHRETHCLTFAQAALLHIKDLFGADLAYRRFVLGSVTGPADGNSRVGIGPAPSVDQQRIAFRIVFASFQVLRHVNQSSIGRTSFSNTDTLRHDIASRLVGSMNHFGSRILVLPVAG